MSASNPQLVTCTAECFILSQLDQPQNSEDSSLLAPKADLYAVQRMCRPGWMRPHETNSDSPESTAARTAYQPSVSSRCTSANQTSIIASSTVHITVSESLPSPLAGLLAANSCSFKLCSHDGAGNTERGGFTCVGWLGRSHCCNAQHHEAARRLISFQHPLQNRLVAATQLPVIPDMPWRLSSSTVCSFQSPNTNSQYHIASIVFLQSYVLLGCFQRTCNCGWDRFPRPHGACLTVVPAHPVPQHATAAAMP